MMPRTIPSLLLCLAASTVAAACADESPTGSAVDELSAENGPITAAEILARADYWYQIRWNGDMTYNQGASHVDPEGKPYRRDCSGYVSMAWHLDHSRVTFQPDSLANVAMRISRDALQPGDLVLASEG